VSLPRETVLELMALADGELEGEAKERAEKLAAQSDEAQRVVSAMRAPGVRLWLGEAVEQRAACADGIADAVMARLDPREAHVAIRRLPTGRSGRSPRKAMAIAGAAAVSALAIAAAFMLYARSGNRTGERAPVASIVAPNSAPRVPEAVAHEERPAPARGVEVEEIDSAAHVSIFAISALANADAPSSVVVWIEDDTGEK
jgi:hypothetical protein